MNEILEEIIEAKMTKSQKVLHPFSQHLLHIFNNTTFPDDEVDNFYNSILSTLQKRHINIELKDIISILNKPNVTKKLIKEIDFGDRITAIKEIAKFITNGD